MEEACDATIGVDPAAAPSDLVDLYRDGHDRYRELYPALAPSFHLLAEGSAV